LQHFSVINAAELAYSLKFAGEFRTEAEHVLPREVNGADQDREGRK
jgi:hypothetical protein